MTRENPETCRKVWEGGVEDECGKREYEESKEESDIESEIWAKYAREWNVTQIFR